MEFQMNIETVHENVNKWFKQSFLSLNNEKTHYIHLKTRTANPLT
jgi:hypothetical protein